MYSESERLTATEGGIQTVLPADYPPVLVDHLGIRFENALQEGNTRISDNLHDQSFSILQI